MDRCTEEGCQGTEISRLLAPAEDNDFVLRPKHSAFYCTSLEVLLSYLGAKKLIVTGFAGAICVLLTANDAYMRDYEPIVPADCIASESVAANASACRHMKRFLRADIRTSRHLRPVDLK